jgi:hypothetical protein
VNMKSDDTAARATAEARMRCGAGVATDAAPAESQAQTGMRKARADVWHTRREGRGGGVLLCMGRMRGAARILQRGKEWSTG